MWDIGMQPSLAEAATNSSDVLSMLLLVFLTVVGLAAALVILEAIHSHRSQKLQTAQESSPTTCAAPCPENAHSQTK